MQIPVRKDALKKTNNFLSSVPKSIRRGPNNVSFVCYDATCLSQIFHEFSVDLITVAQALHWFDRPKFYEECKKVLKPGGLFVAYGYGMHWFEDPKIEMMKREVSLNHYSFEPFLVALRII